MPTPLPTHLYAPLDGLLQLRQCVANARRQLLQRRKGLRAALRLQALRQPRGSAQRARHRPEHHGMQHAALLRRLHGAPHIERAFEAAQQSQGQQQRRRR